MIENAQKNNASIVVVTGGEPTIHNLNELCALCSEANLPVHLETSGAFEIKGTFDWITLSPKEWKLPLQKNIQSANEIKNRLEQLRALDNNIGINVALAKSSPIGVDTEEDFLAIKKIMEYKS